MFGYLSVILDCEWCDLAADCSSVEGHCDRCGRWGFEAFLAGDVWFLA